MADGTAVPTSVSKFKSTPGIQWVAGLVVATILSLLFSLVVVAPDNEWVLLFLLAFLGLILAAAVGFAVRLTTTTAGGGAFWPAAVSAGLGIHTLTSMAGVGFDDYGYSLLSVFQSAPLSAYVVFYGVVAGVIAVFARRP